MENFELICRLGEMSPKRTVWLALAAGVIGVAFLIFVTRQENRPEAAAPKERPAPQVEKPRLAE